jgi:GrpB-like predicted nucleotidyltransferase (UPF0157 family)
VRTVALVPHREQWAVDFEREAAAVRAILGWELITVHHVGSTAIPGIAAKPIIDLLPVVRSLAAVDAAAAAFADRGYLFRGEHGIPERRYVVAVAPDGGHRAHIHIYPEGHPQIERHLAFRDHLRRDRSAARAYESLKLELKERFEHDRAAYQDGKAEFCQRIIAVELARSGRGRS